MPPTRVVDAICSKFFYHATAVAPVRAFHSEASSSRCRTAAVEFAPAAAAISVAAAATVATVASDPVDLIAAAATAPGFAETVVPIAATAAAAVAGS